MAILANANKLRHPSKRIICMTNIPFVIPKEALCRCESEAIRTPSSVQPFGCLIVFSLSNARILQVSENAEIFLGFTIQQLLDKSLNEILELEFSQESEKTYALLPHKPETVELRVKLTGKSGQAFIHQVDGVGILELESTEFSGAVTNRSTENIIQLRKMIASIARQETLEDFFDESARCLREISGYERVCVYQFVDNNHGLIVGESTNGRMEQFKGLKFPNFDIPKNSRELFSEMKIGHVYSMDYVPVPLIPQLNPETNKPLNMTYCLCRSHSPNCVNYYRNMGVNSNFTTSIISHHNLWGLFTFHHTKPHLMPIYRRSIVELLTESISTELSNRIEKQQKIDEVRSEKIRIDLQQRMDPTDSWPDVLFQDKMISELMSIMDSTGVFYFNEQSSTIHQYGFLPEKKHLIMLGQWLSYNQKENIFQSKRISDQLPEFTSISPVISGVMSLKFPTLSPKFLIWILPQEESQIKWSGVPTKEVKVKDGEYYLHPRSNFSAWVQEQRHTSREWTTQQAHFAKLFHESISTVYMRYHELKSKFLTQDLIRMNKAIEFSAEPIILMNEQELVIYTNSAFEKLFAFSLEELNSKSELTFLIESKNLQEHQKKYYIDELRYFIPNINLITKHQKVIECSFASSLILDASNQTIGRVINISDLSSLRQIQEEQRLLETKIFEYQKLESLRILAGGVAHDFNNLLVGILGSVGLAKMDCDEKHPIWSSLNIIEQASERAAELTKQMLAYSGQGRFQIKVVNLNTLIQGMLELLKSYTKHKTTISFIASPNIPLVEVDETQIHQVILNLVINASEAIQTTDGRIKLKTYLQCFTTEQLEQMTVPPPSEKVQRFVCLEVMDNGGGMTPETINRVFEPFYSTKSTGRGLGMAAVHGIVRSHKGFMNILSEPERGTTMTVGLPVFTESNDEVAVDFHPTVLVVDDESFVHSVINSILDRLKIRHVNVECGEDALNQLERRQTTFHLVLLDITMPGMNGWQTLEKISEFDPHLPVIMMSGFNQADFDDEMTAYQVVDFIPKPFKTTELYKLLSDFFAKFSSP